MVEGTGGVGNCPGMYFLVCVSRDKSMKTALFYVGVSMARGNGVRSGVNNRAYDHLKCVRAEKEREISTYTALIKQHQLIVHPAHIVKIDEHDALFVKYGRDLLQLIEQAHAKIYQRP